MSDLKKQIEYIKNKREEIVEKQRLIKQHLEDIEVLLTKLKEYRIRQRLMKLN